MATLGIPGETFVEPNWWKWGTHTAGYPNAGGTDNIFILDGKLTSGCQTATMSWRANLIQQLQA